MQHVQVLLVPMRTGGGAAGLTLTVADLAVLLDPSTAQVQAPTGTSTAMATPTPAAMAMEANGDNKAQEKEEMDGDDNNDERQFAGLSNLERQAIGRLHRIGQQRPVSVVRIAAVWTVESRLVATGQEQRGGSGRRSPGPGGKAHMANWRGCWRCWVHRGGAPRAAMYRYR